MHMNKAGRARRIALKASLLALPVLAGGGLGMLLVYYAAIAFEAGEDASRVDWLPESAARICWYRSYLNTAVEFDMPEEDFLAWARSENGKKNFMLGEIEPIGKTDWFYFQYALPRYTKFLVPEYRLEKGLPPLPPVDLRVLRPPEPDGEEKIDMAVDDRGHPRHDFRDGVQLRYVPEHGCKYEKIYGNGGGVWLAYDADLGRAFYYTCPR